MMKQQNHNPPDDDLDALLRQWHEVHAERAREGRDDLLQALAGAPAHSGGPHRRISPIAIIRRTVASPYVRAAASFLLLVTLIALLMPLSDTPAHAQEIMVPDGGRLEAFDEQGNAIGPCALQHTDVDVAVSGRFTRVTLTQHFHNPYEEKIEAVYTFPLSHRAAVDRMKMIVGDRVVIGEVKERQEARRVYEAARASGYVASLLEQERPNIFTQSIANIEPGADVRIEISYVEILHVEEGVFRFDFPMTVAPRYIPGSPAVSRTIVPAELTRRHGIILRGKAQLTLGQPDNTESLGTLQIGKLDALLHAAQPIRYPGSLWWGEGEDAKLPDVWYPFQAAYCNGSKEIGWLYTDGTGQINGRWFFTDPQFINEMGTGFSPDTNRVPDASRITPMPVRPPKRAGHDISVTVSIDTGGPGILDVKSELHDITFTERLFRDDNSPRRVTLALADRSEIPNRDFLLSWRQTDDTIEEAIFTHRPPTDRDPQLPGAGFFTLMLQPPARVDDEDVRARELIFVLDCSGSMKDFPIEKAKDVMLRAIDTMRADDTFNVITFNNTAETLWDAPRPNTDENRAAAKAYVDSRQGGGGTEMKKAVLAALQPRDEHPAPLTPAQLADLPADGREVESSIPSGSITPLFQDGAAPSVVDIAVRDDLTIRALIQRWTLHGGSLGGEHWPADRTFIMRGRWETVDGRRVFNVAHAFDSPEESMAPLRIVFFLTDGEVGNDDEIIQSVRDHADTARVFTVGIGSSPNRYLLDEMARAGRGKSDYVSLQGDANAAVNRFVRRVTTPVLTDVNIRFGNGLEIIDTIPPLDAMPDLFDEQPLIVYGRYTEPGEGMLTITGNTGAGRWERNIDLALPAAAPEHDVIATLWARAQVDELMRKDDIPGVIALGEEFQIVTQHTSFVAVEKSRLTIDGKPMLVSIPIEMPAGQSWQGTFGGAPDGEQLAAQEYDHFVNKFGRAWHEEDGNWPSLMRRLRDVDGDGFSDKLWDVSGATGEINGSETARAYSLRFTDPERVADKLEALLGQSESERVRRPSREAGQSGAGVADILAEIKQIQVDPMTGEVLVLSDSPASLEFLDAVVASLDQPTAAMRRADELLGQEDFDAAERAALTARIGLRNNPSTLPQDQYEKLCAQAEQQLDRIDQARERTRTARGEQAGSEVLQHIKATEQHTEAIREREVNERLSRVRQLQQQQKYGQALQVVDEVLFLDQKNPTALLLKDVLETTQIYKECVEQQRLWEQENPELALQNQERLSLPHRYITAPSTDQISALAQGAPVTVASPGAVSPSADPHLGEIPLSGKPVVLHFSGAAGGGGATGGAAAQFGGTVELHTLNFPWQRGGRENAGGDMAFGVPPVREGVVPFYIERTIVFIALLVESGEMERARSLAEDLADCRPDHALVVALNELMMDETITDDERRTKVTEVAQQAQQDLLEYITVQRILNHLTRILHASLLPFAVAQDMPEELDETYDRAKPEGAVWKDGGVLVSILMQDLHPEALDALVEAGLKIEARSESLPLVVGIAPLGRIGDLAFIEGVRRIEPTEAIQED